MSYPAVVEPTYRAELREAVQDLRAVLELLVQLHCTEMHPIDVEIARDKLAKIKDMRL